jgi:hypothetical protein
MKIDTIDELRNAKEGEQYQFKEAKTPLTQARRLAAAALFQTAAAGNWFLASRTNDRVRWSEAKPSTSRSAPAKGLSTNFA